MSTQENLQGLSRRITDAPKNSEEFWEVEMMDRLRANLQACEARARDQLAEFQSSIQHSEVPGQTLRPSC